MSAPDHQRLKNLPAVETLLQDPAVARLADDVPRRVLVECVRRAVDSLRGELIEGRVGVEDASSDADALRQILVERIRAQAAAATKPYYQKVINATGIILHTGLGRAVLPAVALARFQEELGGYSLLQTDLETGRRSRRDAPIERLLQTLTGAEAATVVNNNAAATMIVLNTIGQGREVIVSRGQLVEIGGSFRLPDVMAKSGVRMVEVGTTNKTHARDYEAAITDATAAIMRVHPSNYKISGFTSEVPLDTLVEIAHRHGLPLIDDVGAGSLVDFSQFGFEPEPTLGESIRAGADIVTSSGDKLIGATQAGIILGRADLVEAVRKNPLARIVRVDKLTLSALEATLSLFLDETTALAEVPTLAMLRRGPDDVGRQAERIAEAVLRAVPGAGVTVVDGCSQMGSGSLPTQNLPTRLVTLDPPDGSADGLALALRGCRPPVFARIQKDQILIDPRTVLDGEEPLLVEAIVRSLRP
ncbi:MAG TPA: L-seryl-tRNA(Sec) selenium transferase [Thermoguttaceae bacterium]|nr:L-seryl-tRNA(Sec) selenium transferase [Thermoguttaceae bacterium]